MTSRSSRSSLVGPPTTVMEDDDSVRNGIQNENMPNWTLPRSSRDEIDPMLSPQVERAMRGFNEDLDTLAKSIEKLIQKNRNSTKIASSTRTPRAPEGSNYSNHGSSYREKDPPPSVQESPLRSFIMGTPVKRSGSASYTPSEPPPAPVETPGFGSPTPNRHRSRRTTAPAPPPPPRVDESYVFSQHEPTPTKPRDSRDSKLDELYKIIKEQESRIRDLEIENEVLRKKLQLMPPSVERVHRASSIVGDFFPEPNQDPTPKAQTSHHPPAFERNRATVEETPRRARSERSTYPEEPQGRHQSVEESPYRAQSSFFSTPSRRDVDHPPRQIHTTGGIVNSERTDFTPGTRFVAELAMLMKLERSHMVPLSFMIDKHWDRLKVYFQGEHDRE